MKRLGANVCYLIHLIVDTNNKKCIKKLNERDLMIANEYIIFLRKFLKKEYGVQVTLRKIFVDNKM